MSDLRELYQEVILDHNRAPRNFYRMEGADRSIEGYNPLCGDHYTMFLKMDGDRIAEISFEGAGCAISKASASVLTEMAKGMTRSEFSRKFSEFHGLVKGEIGSEEAFDRLGKLAAFSGVSEFPARVKCASLPWHTLRGALEDKQEMVTTE